MTLRCTSCSMLMKKSLLGGTILHGQWQCLTLSSPGDCWRLWSAEPPSPKQQWQERHQAAVTDCCWRLRFSAVSLPLGHHSQSVFPGEAKIIQKKKNLTQSVYCGEHGQPVSLGMRCDFCDCVWSAMCVIIMQATRRAWDRQFHAGLSKSH